MFFLSNLMIDFTQTLWLRYWLLRGWPDDSRYRCRPLQCRRKSTRRNRRLHSSTLYWLTHWSLSWHWWPLIHLMLWVGRQTKTRWNHAWSKSLILLGWWRKIWSIYRTCRWCSRSKLIVHSSSWDRCWWKTIHTWWWRSNTNRLGPLPISRTIWHCRTRLYLHVTTLRQKWTSCLEICQMKRFMFKILNTCMTSQDKPMYNLIIAL